VLDLFEEGDIAGHAGPAGALGFVPVAQFDVLHAQVPTEVGDALTQGRGGFGIR
jgi:hypothetical protein